MTASDPTEAPADAEATTTTTGEAAAQPAAQPSGEASGEASAEEADDTPVSEDFAAPFIGRSFGGEFVWASSDNYVAKVLRVHPGEKVVVSTRGRKDMVAMLTGGRAVLEVIEGDDVEHVEILPAAPVQIEAGRDYRLVAMTEVELFTIYTQL